MISIQRRYENIWKIATGQGDDYTNTQLTNTQISKIHKASANSFSANDIKLSKTQLSRMEQLGGFLGRLLGPLLKTGLPFMKNVLKPLAKSVLIPLGITAGAGATIQKKNYWSRFD